ncbi:hypothetical protein GCM10010293_64010 [Streptomyces griseoflavus]|nr:hypothetical protein GCM10010293_64010 [Streptomyces griseoflavus]
MLEVRHGDGLRQGPRSEGLDFLGPQEGSGPEGRSPAARGEETLQRCDLCVQFLRAAPGLRLPVLAMAPVGSPLIRPRLLFLLSAPSGFGFQLPLLLPLHLGPDADETGGTTTHVLQALPKARFGCPRNHL